jgi:hypothetical protein
MTSRLELNSRAALCRQLAKREPTTRTLWMAEAETGRCLSKEKLRGEAGAQIGPASWRVLRVRSARCSSIPSIEPGSESRHCGKRIRLDVRTFEIDQRL